MAFIDQLESLTSGEGHREFSGVVLVRKSSRDVYSAANGYANRSWSIKNEIDTRFRVASVAKMFTAVAALQLVDAGELELSTYAAEFLGLEQTAIPKDVTVHHLLTMTAGIADWFDESGDWEENWAALVREHPLYLFRQNRDYLPLFANTPPVAPVGEKHRYSNSSYILLGLMIERASGLSYVDYVRRHVFAQARMTRSGFAPLDDVEREVAEGYVPVTDAQGARTGWKKNIYSVTPEAAADGGATSTARDLCRFSKALREGRLLSPELTRKMLTPKVLEDDEPYRGYIWRYGYGNLFLIDGADQIVRWGHMGEEAGVSCRLYHYPRQDVDAAILGNQSGCAGDLAWALHDLVMAAL